MQYKFEFNDISLNIKDNFGWKKFGKNYAPMYY